MKTIAAEVRKLSAPTEAWLRTKVPSWGDMRDRAIAAGIIDPALPMTPAQKETVEKISEVAGRVRRRPSVSRAATRPLRGKRAPKVTPKQ